MKAEPRLRLKLELTGAPLNYDSYMKAEPRLRLKLFSCFRDQVEVLLHEGGT